MADASYLPKVYRKRGGAEIVIASSGDLTVESGGTATIESGGALTVDSGGTLTNAGTLANTGAITNTGTITNSSDGGTIESITAHSTASAINKYGISLIGSTATGAKAYTLAPPAAAYVGRRKLVICKSSTGGVTLTTTGTFNAAKKVITFGANADGVSVELVAATSAQWSIIGYSTDWTTTIKAT